MKSNPLCFFLDINIEADPSFPASQKNHGNHPEPNWFQASYVCHHSINQSHNMDFQSLNMLSECIYWEHKQKRCPKIQQEGVETS